MRTAFHPVATVHPLPLPHRYAVVGHPVAHSRSPFIHARFAALTGRAVDYGRRPCEPGHFADTLLAMSAEGFRGANVTVPFKFELPPLAAVVTERARLAGAANTVRFDPAGWFADNTDGVGLVRDLTDHAGRSLGGNRVLLLGAGGAAAGVLGPLLAEGPAELVIANRSLHRAQALATSHRDRAEAAGTRLRAVGLDACRDGRESGFGILINGTAASLAGAGVPVAASVLAPGALALDMMYGPTAEPFLDWARAAGAEPRDGLGMLVEQAAEAFQVFEGVRPPTREVLAELRAVLAAEAAR
jgi:shikimate dehydrogenase